MSKIDDVLEQQVYPYYELQYHDEAKEHIKYIKQALYKDMVELIEDNIIYGNEQISKDELLEATRKYYGIKE